MSKQDRPTIGNGTLRLDAARAFMLATALALVAALAGATTTPAPARERFVPVTPQRLRDAGRQSDSWLMYGGDFAAHRFSRLSDISTATVAKLQPAWKRSLGPRVSMEATPLIDNGVLYVPTGKSTLYALDATTGATLWRYVYPLPDTVAPHACCNYDNRGVTLLGDTVFLPTLDAHLVALDARTGSVRWRVTVAPASQGYTITSPPLPVKDMVVTGVAGGEYRIRGFVAAYDAKTGRQRWRTYTIPAKGQPGYDTWTIPGSAERGGAPTWLPGTYDPELDTIYWGVGNPHRSLDPNVHKGDEWYTDSLLALDPATGRIKWFHKFTPYDIWDYDGVNEAVLVDLPMHGRLVHALAHADRNGYLYVLDRTNGRTLYVVPFVDRITWGSVDKTGRTRLNEEMLAAASSGKAFVYSPGMMGGKNWPPTAYDPRTHRLFIPAIESTMENRPRPPDPPLLGWIKHLLLPVAHALFPERYRYQGAIEIGGGFSVAGHSISGSIVAIDLVTGKQVWKTRFRSPQLGGLLATAGGLVFAGEPEGDVVALDERDGKIVWRSHVASGINAPPVTYAANGRQYVAVAVGSGGAWQVSGWMEATPWLRSVPLGAYVYAFALPNAPPRRR